MKTPLISVVVPLYNYSQYIEWCIQSIINQDYPNWELIVVDDCSTDDSYKIAKNFESSNIHIIQLPENSGYSKAKNEGIVLSKGKYIVTIDADDMLTRNSLSCRIKCSLKRKIPFIHAQAVTVGPKMSLQDCYDRTRFKRQKPKIHAQTVLAARWIYQKYGLYDENLRSRSDKEMWWRLFDKGCVRDDKVKRFFLKKDVAYYRSHHLSMMHTRRKNKKYNRKVAKKLEDAYRMRQNYGITPKNTRFLEN